MSDGDTSLQQFTFASIQKNVLTLKPMLKNNPSDLEKNNARRSLCAIAKLIASSPAENIIYDPIDASNVSLILHGVFHTSSLPTTTLGSNKPSVNLSPIYVYLENNFWKTGCSHWTATEIGDVLKICFKISSVPIVSILASLIWPTIRMAPKLTPTELVLLARCFHSVGMKHPRLHSTVMQLVKDLTDQLSADDLNRILLTMVESGSREDISKLLQVLIKKATQNVRALSAPIVSRSVNLLMKCSKNYPLMTAEMKTEIDEFQDILYTRAIETIACAPVSEVAELCSNFAVMLSKDRFKKIFELTSERVISLSQSLKPRHIAMLFHACHQQHILDEKLLNVLAEKSCALLSAFDESEIADVIESLASFDLYDAELFTMAAARFAQKTRDREVLDPASVTRVLQSFGKLKEKNDALLFACAQQYAISLYNLSRDMMESVLAIFKQFDFNHRDIVVQIETRLQSMDAK